MVEADTAAHAGQGSEPGLPIRLCLLGATGSIGSSTLAVLRAHPQRFQLTAIAGQQNIAGLAAIAKEFNVPHVCIYSGSAHAQAKAEGTFPQGTTLHCGAEGLDTISTLPEVDTALVAIVGTAGLRPTLAAIQAGKRIALASKEVLVLAGPLVMEAARAAGTDIIPVDSEHNALFQCLQGLKNKGNELKKLWLTASGGAFRDTPAEALQHVRVEDALQHPNWSMGAKITIDSATMANKGLELIEAQRLFGVAPAQVGAVVHRESIVHGLVECTDGCMLAQLSPPEMAFAVQHALLYPSRAAPTKPAQNMAQPFSLNFEPVNLAKYPCFALAIQAMEAGGNAPAIYNAANEIAVAAFLEKRTAFLSIASIIETTLTELTTLEAATTLEACVHADAQARVCATAALSKFAI